MKTLSLLVLAVSLSIAAMAQESNEGKKLWAKSILNEKAPALVVSEWISKQPETKGKFVLVDFWATWCGPCKKAIPELNAFQKKFSDQLIVIGISDQKANEIKAFKDPLIEYFCALDTLARLKKAIEVDGIPHVILIDPKGIVRWEGFPSLQGFELTEEVLTRLMKKYK